MQVLGYHALNITFVSVDQKTIHAKISNSIRKRSNNDVKNINYSYMNLSRHFKSNSMHILHFLNI